MGLPNSFGQVLMAATNDIVTIDDRRFQIRLKKPFSQMLYGLGARNCFMMPERMATTPSSEQIKEAVGSGPFRFLPDEWVSGACAGYARFEAAAVASSGCTIHSTRSNFATLPPA
jgi:peptide/nickel transport system substrate-binding protein